MGDFLLPVFPLEIVLLPEESLPLHIFEERYKLMINECLEAKASRPEQQEFGVVLAENGELAPIGCSARITEVARKYPDGRMDIMTEGCRRFEIVYINEEEDYLRGDVHFFGDEAGADVPAKEQAEIAFELFGEAAKRLGKDSPAVAFSPPYRRLSFRIAGLLPVELALKQELLGMRRESNRLEKLTDWLKHAIEQIETSEKRWAKARGNGNPLQHIG